MDAEEVRIEEAKLSLERDKLALERAKAKWTALSLAVPLTAAVLTFGAAVWSQAQQAKAQFLVKAAEVVMQAGTPDEASGRAYALKALFPDQLPKNFADRFDPATVTKEDVVGSKKMLIELVSRSPSYRREIIELWAKLFPDENWIIAVNSKEDSEDKGLAPSGSQSQPSRLKKASAGMGKGNK